MKRVIALLIGLLLTVGLLTAPGAQAAPVRAQSVTVSIGHAVPDNIGPYKWDRSTIIIQVVKAGSSLEQTWFHERVSYYRSVAGSTLNILEQGCVINMPCIRAYFDFYGTMGGNDGQTTPAYSNCISTYAWCRYDGTSSLVTHTTVQFTRSYIDVYTYDMLRSLFCHELGRAIADMQSAGGATCMQNATYQYPSLTSAEEASVRAKYTGLPRLANHNSRSDYELAR